MASSSESVKSGQRARRSMDYDDPVTVALICILLVSGHLMQNDPRMYGLPKDSRGSNKHGVCQWRLVRSVTELHHN